jgi:prolyl-tRNA synthetase
MKDSYSFHATPECLNKEYWNMYETYKRIFKRCGLDYVIVEAESGEMGGSGSHQFTIPCPSGEDVIVYTEDGSYAANIEKAEVDAPSWHGLGARENTARMAVLPELVHTPNVGSIDAVCAFLKTQPADMIKTLIFSADKDVIVALVRGDHEINPEKFTQTLGGKHNELATPETIEKITGAKVGFAGPMGLAGKASKLIIDHAVAAMLIGVAGANKTDYHVKNIVPGRDFPLEGNNVVVADIHIAVEGDTHNGKKLLFKHGIEVGQVFKLGTKYSSKIGCNFLDDSGKGNPCLMGCYGIGINRIVASAIEAANDENGIIFPISISPFEVIIVSVNQDDAEVVEAGEKIYKELKNKGIEVLLDDRDERAGVKFKDADLIGIPVRITVGKKALQTGNVEIKLRTEPKPTLIPVDTAVDRTIELVNELKAKMSM